MTEPFDVENASHEELLAFAKDTLGLKLPWNLPEDKARERVRQELDGPPEPVAPQRARAGIEDVVPLKDLPLEDTAVIVIAEGDRNAVNPVPVIVNGRSFYIPRGRRIRVPNYVVGVLNDAVESRWYHEDPDDLESPKIERKVPSYPFQVFPASAAAENDRRPAPPRPDGEYQVA